VVAVARVRIVDLAERGLGVLAVREGQRAGALVPDRHGMSRRLSSVRT
jgi:hypothetical protein